VESCGRPGRQALVDPGRRHRLCFRHDNVDDWPDPIRAEGTLPGNVGGLDLAIPDARRLAGALQLACDIAEGKAARR
jgi:hypothetical protein